MLVVVIEFGFAGVVLKIKIILTLSVHIRWTFKRFFRVLVVVIEFGFDGVVLKIKIILPLSECVCQLLSVYVFVCVFTFFHSIRPTTTSFLSFFPFINTSINQHLKKHTPQTDEARICGNIVATTEQSKAGDAVVMIHNLHQNCIVTFQITMHTKRKVSCC